MLFIRATRITFLVLQTTKCQKNSFSCKNIQFMKPEISVIIPLYNKEKIIRQCVDSILTQTFQNFELIIVNDGSTDNSLEILEKIQDSRICIINQENGGPSKARNTGIKNANADWLYFIDADDCATSGCLQHFYELIQLNPQIEMFCGEVLLCRNNKNRIAKTYINGIVKNPFKIFVQNKLFQCSGSSIYSKNLCMNHLYDERLRRFEDLECLFRRYHATKLFLTHFVVAQINVNFASASSARKSIKEDFLGHLTFEGKSFWEKMALYKLYLEERNHYSKEIDKLYPLLRLRYDFLLYYKLTKL